MRNCPECGCCCDYSRECCPNCHSGNIDHLGECGGCKRIDPRDIPAELRIGPRRPCGKFFCWRSCGRHLITDLDKPCKCENAACV